MPLLDDKYEIISQQPLGSQQTLFEAIAPDGTALRIVWFDLLSLEEESAFEQYRQLLRALRRENLAAIHDLVSRPGAHYVAWLYPETSDHGPVPNDKVSQEIVRILQAHGRQPAEAEVRTNGTRAKVYGLAFGGALPVPATHAPGSATTQLLGRWRAGSSRVPLALSSWLRLWAPGLLFAVVGIMLLITGFIMRTNDHVVTVPAVNGSDVNTAAQTLHALGFVTSFDAVFSEAPAGQVLSVTPKEGTRLRPGRTVNLLYALPHGQLPSTTVPDLRGRTLGDDLQARLQAAQLELGRIAYVPAQVEQGVVISQSVTANEEVPFGTVVDVLVSDGPSQEMLFLPDLVGVPEEVARELVRDAGFNGLIDVATEMTTQAPAGTVIWQSVPPFVPVVKDAVSLRLTVAVEPGATPAAGSPGASWPDLVGLSEREAKQVAEEAGFQVGKITYIDDDRNRNLPEGVVGWELAEGSSRTLDLVMNMHRTAIPTPDVQVFREPRRVPYAWYIEPGIPEQVAVVQARTVSGETVTVLRERVRGGEQIEGIFQTSEAGPVEFFLTLNGEFYPSSEPLRVNP